MIPGLTTRLTSSGLPVIRIHFSADPGKRPGTPEGDRWLESAAGSYPGGVSSPRWRKEMGIEWGALGGVKVIPEWERWARNGKIVIPPFHAEGYRIYASYDHGHRNPAAYGVFGMDSDGNLAGLWSFYAAGVTAPYIARIIRGEDVQLPDGRYFPGNPYAGKETWKIADPSIWAEDQAMSDATQKSIAELFRREGVIFQKGEKGGDSMVAEWLLGFWWKDPEAPRFRIASPEGVDPIGRNPFPSGYSGPGCPHLVWEIGQQRHREFSARVALNRDQPEALIDKDNHFWDAMKMLMKRFPPKALGAKAAEKPNTFNWWREVAKRQGRDQSIYGRLAYRR